MNREATIDVPVLILGAGLAGLSTAYHLKQKTSMVVERENEVGGTARSIKINGFTFDFTGHLLHLHTPYTKKLIRQLLKNQFYSCIRKAWIYSHHTYTRYPFQASTYGLPDNVIDDCILGVLETTLNQNYEGHRRAPHNFYDWCQSTFGPGISKHFMIPYNQKLYQTAATKMTSEWCGSFVPTPKLEEVINGALEEQKKDFGYNTTFLYPKKGGIQGLAQSLGEKVENIRLGTSIRQILWKEKKAILTDGTLVSYKSLVNTIPLLELLNLMKPLPHKIETRRKQLKFASILCLNIGVKRPHISDSSWIYFPEPKYLFYRVGFPMNFTPHVVPKGCSSMYVEIPMKAIKNLSKKQIISKVRQGLIDTKILKRSDRLPVIQFLPIRYAYVIYDKNRSIALSEIFSFLGRNKIQSIGRYGAWKYSFMEEAILDGKKAAESISRSLS